VGAAGLVDSKVCTAQPHSSFPTKARDRLSLTSWPFRAYIDAPGNSERKNDKPGMDIRGFVSMAAEKFGIHNVNPLASHFRSHNSEFVTEFRVALEKSRSRVVDLGLSGRPFYHPDADQRDAAVNYGKQWIDVAVVLEAPSVRQHVSGVPGRKADVELAASSLGKMAEYGAARNTVVNLENDDPESEDPFFLARVIDKVGSPYLRGLPDFANSLLPSGDAENNVRGVREMFRRAWNMCHVKPGVSDDHGTIYRVDLKRMFDIAKESGYRGYYCMESDLPGDPFAATEALIRETLTFLV
jgi:sugar phosphate isomerase/epimerase